VAPGGRVTVSVTLPAPAAVNVAPPVPTAVQVVPTSCASGTDTGTPAAVLGPVFLTTTVIVSAWPAVTVAWALDTATLTSPVGFSPSMSAVELLPSPGSVNPAGAVMPAVAETSPVASGRIVPVTVNVTVPPAGRVTAELMSPVPPTGAVAPPVVVVVHFTFCRVAGNVPVTVAPAAVFGPVLD